MKISATKMDVAMDSPYSMLRTLPLCTEIGTATVSHKVLLRPDPVVRRHTGDPGIRMHEPWVASGCELDVGETAHL